MNLSHQNGSRNSRSLLFSILWLCTISGLHAFSMTPKNDPDGSSSSLPELSRRQLLTWPIGIGSAVVYGKLVADAAQKLARGDLVYPDDHENRVALIIAKATSASIPRDTSRPLRVLEVGIGKDWRVERRGLYRTAVDSLSARGVTKMDLTGLDIVIPSSNTIEDARSRMQKLAFESKMEIDVNAMQGSITSPLDIPGGYFDCVICALTLCSVDDQTAALQEMKRLLRPDGGTFAYVEHVAVDSAEPYRLLDLQQRLLDPLQQVVADNCHLHRFTEENIVKTFNVGDNNYKSSQIFSERFLVDGMWPVSCQCCGVVQRNA